MTFSDLQKSNEFVILINEEKNPMQRRSFIKKAGTAGLLTLITPTGIIQAFGKSADDTLEKLFKHPPTSARPYTWWHWMNGNVTKEGITLDLEAMKEIGLGGFQNFDAGTGIPKGPVVYLSPEWLKLKEHAIKEADRLGLEFGMHNCPGWSSSGGPWITPALGMQQLTWSEMRVPGGNSVNVKLPQPPARLEHYRDIVVLAFPSLQGELPMPEVVKQITTSDGTRHESTLTSSLVPVFDIQPQSGSGNAWLQFEFKEPFDFRAVQFSNTPLTKGVVNSSSIVLEWSDDGHQFKKLTEIRADEPFVLAEFPAIKARYFRIVSSDARRFEQLQFSNTLYLKDWRKKANYEFSGVPGFAAHDIDTPGAAIIDSNAIIDVTSKVDKEGILRWEAPIGNWTILRFGFTPTGTMNRSAPDTGVGLECDKYSREAIGFHFQKMMENLLPTLGPLAKKGKVGLLIDSYEVGMQNWTPLFPTEFEKQKGYNVLTYLPAMTGRIVGSVDSTERFLWDIRRVQANLIADNYYGALTDLCHQHGMISYTQPYDRGPMEEMQIGSRVDINEGEFWNGLSTLFQNNWMMRRTMKLSASIAHVNGQKIVGGESFTSEPESARWQEYPFAMKALGDKMFTQGLNRVVFHRYAHQPHPTALPGMTMGPWGIHFDRTNTWWKPGKAWIDYLSRCQSLLQQGLFVADLVYFTGEEGNAYAKVQRNQLSPAPPEGYEYDLINAEVILKSASVKNGRLTLPDGMSYRLFVLQDIKAVSLEVLQKLNGLVKQGLILVGAKPIHSLGLSKANNQDSTFQRLTDELWGEGDGQPKIKRKIGLGQVIWGYEMQDILKELSVPPDFLISSRSGDAPVNYIHRQDKGTDVYFIANQRRSFEELICTFRVGKKQPELWDPGTGAIAPVSVYEVTDSGIRLPISMDPSGSVFVVFRTPITQPQIQAVIKDNVSVLSAKPFPEVSRKLYKGVQNNFTISVWVKPELNVMLSTRNFMEGIADPWTDYYAIYPSSGSKLYGAGHATCGMTIGRNGIAVWENEKGTPVLTLAAPASISGWSNVTLVYRNGAPVVYVNGIKIQEGKASAYIVHPGVGQAYLKEGASYYNGDIKEPQLFEEVLSEERIKQLATTAVIINQAATAVVEQAGDRKPALLCWKNGKYSLRYNTGKSAAFAVNTINDPVSLNGSWKVSFPSNMGAPPQVTLPELISLHKHADSGVKYFSGTATYQKEFTLPVNAIGMNKQLFLDLGQVEVMAEVVVNGTNLGILWKRPYQVNITKAVKAGVNTLEVKVTNLWPNRLIGDEQLPDANKFTAGGGAGGFASLTNGAIEQLPEWYIQGKPKPVDGRVTFTTWKHYNKDSPLLESGLIGPVVVKTAFVAILKQPV